MPGHHHSKHKEQNTKHIDQSLMALVPQTAENGVTLEEKAYHRHQQQRVTRVRNADSPRVVVVTQRHTLTIRIIVQLTETIVVVTERFVHSNRSVIHL